MVQAATVLLVVAVAVIVVAVVAAAVAERWARTRGLTAARRELAARLGTDHVTVDVAERPLLPALLRSSGAEVEVHAEGVPVGDGAVLRSLSGTISAVRVDVRTRLLTTGLGRFTATLDEGELGKLIRLPGVVSRLELGADGLRVWTVLGVAVDADVLVLDGALRVIPDPAQVAPLLALPGVGAFRRVVEGAGLRLELPALPFDAVVEEVAFDVGRAVATGHLAPQELPIR